MIQEKKCKGTGKAKGHGCNKMVPVRIGKRKNRHYGLGMSCGCYNKWLLNTSEGNEVLRRSRITGKKTLEKEAKAKKRKEKESVKKTSEYRKELQVVVNQIVRVIDIDKGCISCTHGWDKNWTRQRHAGHRLSVGSNPQLRYNLHNIHLQCSVCNNFKSGNSRQYDKGLIEQYGPEYLDKCKALTAQYQSLNLSLTEIKEALIKAKNIRKNMLNGANYTREEVNDILGIY